MTTVVDVFPLTPVCNQRGWFGDTRCRRRTWCDVNFAQDQLLRRNILIPLAVKPELHHQPPSTDSFTGAVLIDEGEELTASDAATEIVQHGLPACLGVPASPPGFDRSRLALAAKAFPPHRREEVPHFLAIDGARRKKRLGELRRVRGVDVGVMDEPP